MPTIEERVAYLEGMTSSERKLLSRIDAFDKKFSRYCICMISIQISTLLVIILRLLRLF
ncbi:MAG: hypothetical protein AB1610_03285 [Nitrospirota bacterium]